MKAKNKRKKENTMNIDLTPFLAEALSYNGDLKNEIDNLYRTKNEEFYSYALKSQYYNCILAQERSLIEEELFKKSIGILHYMEENADTKIAESIFNILKKRYKKIYSLFKKFDENRPFDMEELLQTFYSLNQNMSEDEFNANITSAIYFAFNFNNYCNMDALLQCLHTRQTFYSKDNYRFSLKNLSIEDKKEVEKIYKLLPHNLMDYPLSCKPPEQVGYTLLFDHELLSSLSILNNIVYTKDDIKLVVYSYMIHKQLGHTIKLMDYVIPALHIHLLLKAYKKVKEMYFANNKETMYIEFSNMKKELSKTKTALIEANRKNTYLINKETETIDSLLKENERLQKETEKLKKELENAKENVTELNALREFAFHQNEKEEIELAPAIDIEKLNTIKGVLVGGHPKWQNKLKQTLFTWKIINADVSQLDKEIIKNAEIVIFNTSYLSHNLYYFIIDIVKKTKVKLGFINVGNEEKVLKEIETLLYN